MTKIKNFRITLRTRDMARWLKKERGLESVPELELAIDQLVKESVRWVEPAAVYTTLTRAIAEKTSALVFPEKSMAVSVIAVSVGPRLEEERLAARQASGEARHEMAAQSDPSREMLLAALAQEALAQTLHFAVRLVQDQAKEEDCEMSAAMTEHAVAPASHSSEAKGGDSPPATRGTEAGAQNTDARGSVPFLSDYRQGQSPVGDGFRRNDGIVGLANLVGIQRIGIELDPSAPALPPYARVAWLFWTPAGKGAAKRAEKAVA